ncbi:hypothetical protein [Legionella sp. 227]|uniref:hypothetical protein n=1 Tax=Legionella sp. 227 TaxID=3367288 RepID=UPI00370D38B4
MNNTKMIAAICIGNAMEWYDFMIYNFMLLFIAQTFFPSDNSITSLLASIRSTCLAISYNGAVMLFGGFAPFIITAFIEQSKNPMVFSYYLMIAISLSFVAALYLAKTKNYDDKTRMVNEIYGSVEKFEHN